MKKIVLLTLITVLFVLIEELQAQHISDNSVKKVLMIIAPGDFRDEEYNEPKDFFHSNEIQVVTGSTTTNIVCDSRDKSRVKPDILSKDVNVLDYTAIIFVGGPGAR